MDFIELNKNVELVVEKNTIVLKKGDYVRIIRPKNYSGKNHDFFQYKGYQCEIKKIIKDVAKITINSTFNMRSKSVPLEFLIKEI